MSSAYHPQSDGQTKVVNRCIEQFLRCFVHHKPTQWSSLLPWAEYWYNTTYHSSTGMTPFQALYGRAPPPLPAYEIGSSILDELDELLLSREEIFRELRTHLEQANHRMKQLADKSRRDVAFQVDDWVYLRLQPYRQQSVFRRTSQKLSNRFYGPFEVEERVGSVAYRLKLPPGSRIHPVFHISKLKLRIGNTEPTLGHLPPLRSNGELRLTPELALDHRRVAQGTETLVQWEGLPLDEATWECTTQLKASFPHFNLEDKINLQEAGNDTHMISESHADVDEGLGRRRSCRERRRTLRYT